MLHSRTNTFKFFATLSLASPRETQWRTMACFDHDHITWLSCDEKVTTSFPGLLEIIVPADCAVTAQCSTILVPRAHDPSVGFSISFPEPALPLSSGAGNLGADQKDRSLWERDCGLLQAYLQVQGGIKKRKKHARTQSERKTQSFEKMAAFNFFYLKNHDMPLQASWYAAIIIP